MMDRERDTMLDIGMQLKSEEMIELLEAHDLAVHYHFDRLDEGQEDSYTVECEELSLELHFDAAQRCTTIFVRDPELAADEELVAFPDVRTPAEIEAYARSAGARLVRGPS